MIISVRDVRKIKAKSRKEAVDQLLFNKWNHLDSQPHQKRNICKSCRAVSSKVEPGDAITLKGYVTDGDGIQDCIIVKDEITHIPDKLN